MNSTLTFILAFMAAAIRMAVPLTYASLGESISERCGIINIGLESFMLSGAFFGYTAAYYSGSLLVGFICGMLAGMLISLIHGVLTISLHQDQTIAGVALNIFTLGVVTFIFTVSASSSGGASIATLQSIPIPGLSSIPIIGDLLFNNDIVVYLLILLVVGTSFYLRRTFWGMELCAIGENPQAADSVGIRVYKIKYLAELFNGAMCGIGGAYITLAQVGRYTDNITSGRGYIALAIVVFGKRNPYGVMLASLFFGAANALQYRMQSIGIPLPSQLFVGLPYVLTVLALLVSARKGSDPMALGKPYIRSMR